MKQRKNVDQTLKERHRILRLLEQLKQEEISIAEMEEIGEKLGRSGKRALLPLVRRLWREKSGALISKYAYLLDFFDNSSWIDQLLAIALNRRDLDSVGKAALLAALEGYGIDTTAPPLSTLLAAEPGLLRPSLPRHLDRGDEGLICFMEEFLSLQQEARLAAIRELPLPGEPRVLPLLKMLLEMDDREIQNEVVTALGRIRDPLAAALLGRHLENQDDAVRRSAVRSLRRLSFLGITAAEISTVSSLPPFHAAYASPLDSTGLRTVWIARHNAAKSLATLYLQLDQDDGMVAAWGSGDMTREEFCRYLAELSRDDGLVEVEPRYALALMQDGLFRSRRSGTLLPAEFYVWRGMFSPEESDPKPYTPSLAHYDLEMLRVSRLHVASCDLILEEDFFAGWFLADGRVCDYAEEWAELESVGAGLAASRMDSLLERFCNELLVPKIEPMKRRLLLTADLMDKCGKERELVERTIAAAYSLEDYRLRGRHHPFLRQLAVESIDMAREALAEGYDPRRYEGNEDWE